MESKITLAELVDLVELNSLFLVAGTLDVVNSKTVCYTVEDFLTFKVTATILSDGRILDECVETNSATIFTVEEYKLFVQCDADAYKLGEAAPATTRYNTLQNN